MKLLTLEEIVQIHVLLCHETGGSSGVRDLGRLESVIASQTQHLFGEETYSTIANKAAAIIRGIILDHPFIDGNKRTGMLAGLTFLNINGLHFVGEQGSIEDFAVKVAVQSLDIDSIAEWLEANTK